MPLGFDHHSGNSLDVFIGNTLVKQVAHRIHEDHLGSLPTQRFTELFWDQTKVEALFVRVAGYPAKPLCKYFCITMLAARTDLCATAYGVPGCVGPFDCGVLSHLGPPRSARIWRRCLLRSCLRLVVERQRKDNRRQRLCYCALALAWGRT